MAKPRVFVSSTYYDLKHIRASLGLFIDSLGYESILFEKGQIPFISDDPLDVSCYREAESADIFVLIIGGRYGAEASTSKNKNQHPDYNSITRSEYDTASQNHIPTYILIEKGVYAEYQTYKNNRENTTIKYAHVDNINIFKLIDDIHNKPKNNPIFSFEKYNEIEEWLREQWAGLFKDFLTKRGNLKNFESLQNQIQNLENLSDTFKNYLETLLKESNGKDKDNLINKENEKLKLAKFKQNFSTNNDFNFLLETTNFDDKKIKEIYEVFKDSKNIDDLFENLEKLKLPFKKQSEEKLSEALISESESLKGNINDFMISIGLEPIDYQELI
ncbi:MAG: DUF4062 domain-containing protein [Acinetobacter venetianus]|uniref:DUF4062 domain-containing protein n=1 Tax=Acinetobacter venetianus TaxID=52133 RepID=UPI003C7916C4